MNIRYFYIFYFFQFEHALLFGFESLPNAITSFGAVKIENYVYVYGGHTGGAHIYSTF